MKSGGASTPTWSGSRTSKPASRRRSMRRWRWLRPAGWVWVFDLVESSITAVQGLMRRRYGEYLAVLKGEAYRDHVFAYVEQEDTPRPLLFQLDMLRQAGFAHVEVLHKNVCFAAFGAVKG